MGISSSDASSSSVGNAGGTSPCRTALVQMSALISSAALPATGWQLAVAAFGGQVSPTRRRHPAHHLRRSEMLRSTADLPDPLVGLVASARARLRRSRPARPRPAPRSGQHRRGMDIHSAEEHPPHVVLVLVPGAVADPDRTRSLVPGEVVESPLGQVALPRRCRT